MTVKKREMLTRDAVKLLPMSEPTLQKWLRDAYMQRARPCPFGEAVLTEKGEWQYLIFPVRLNLYLTGSDLILTAAPESKSNNKLLEE